MFTLRIARYCTAQSRTCITVKVPFLGDSIADVDIIKFYKNEGDNIIMDEVVCEVEGDKGTQPVNTPYSGILSKVHAKVDDKLLIGEPLFDVYINRYRPHLIHTEKMKLGIRQKKFYK